MNKNCLHLYIDLFHHSFGVSNLVYKKQLAYMCLTLYPSEIGVMLPDFFQVCVAFFLDGVAYSYSTLKWIVIWIYDKVNEDIEEGLKD